MHFTSLHAAGADRSGRLGPAREKPPESGRYAFAGQRRADLGSSSDGDLAAFSSAGSPRPALPGRPPGPPRIGDHRTPIREPVSPSPLPLGLAARAPAAPAPPDPVLGGGRLLTTTRIGIVGLLVLALANGAWLFFLPGRALTDYAWAIKPPINAAFIGAGFLAGTVATGLVVFGARSWRSLRILPLPLAVLASTVLGATLLHADRFFWDYLPTWGWTGVYAAVPALVLGFWVVQPARRPIRGCSGCAAAQPCSARCSS